MKLGAFAQHVREVEEAYRQKLKRKPPKVKPYLARISAEEHAKIAARGIEAQRRVGLAPIHERRRQCEGKRRDGKPCRAPAMRGAKHCRRHGGYIENPAHPGSIKRLLSGKLHRALKTGEAAGVWRGATPEERETVLSNEITDPRPSYCTRNRAAGVEAYRRAHIDGGAGWRQWIASQKPPPDADNPKYRTYVEHAKRGI